MKLALFFFDGRGRLRSGWRSGFFIALFVFGGAVFGTAVMLMLGSLEGGFERGNRTGLLISSLTSLIVAILAGWFCGKFLEKLPFRALGVSFTSGWGRNALIGILLGVLGFSLAAGLGILSGGLSFTLNAGASAGEIVRTAIISFVIFAVAAAFEEVLFRGYLLQTFIRSNLTWFGMILTSVLFATVHNANPSATWLSWLNTFIAGLWFGAAYLRTRDLWLPTGLHLAWNWAQGAIYGVEVSGLKELVPHPVLREFDRGPDWLTGGQYGIEGGILSTAALALSLLAVIYFPGLRADHEMAALDSPAEGPATVTDESTAANEKPLAPN